MSVIETIDQDFKEAFKAKREAAVSTLRMLKAALKNRQIELMHPLTDEEAFVVLKSQIKQNKDSLAEFERAGRVEQTQDLKAEVDLLEKYLPAQLSDEELERVVREAVEASGVKDKKDMGRAMGAAMGAVAGRADGTRVKTIVQTILAVLALMIFAVAVPEASAKIVSSGGLALSGDGTFVFMARLFRAVLLIFAIVAVNLILSGAFMYMTSHGNDKHHVHALRNIITGTLSSFAVMVLFSVTTVVIQTAR